MTQRRRLTKLAPACSSTSATSVCPFSHAYVNAVSPVAVVAWTFAPDGNIVDTDISLSESHLSTSHIYAHFFCIPAANRYLTNSKWPSCAASIKGVEQPSSISAPALMRKSATSKKPPQQARVKAVSWVSSVWALMLAPEQHDQKWKGQWSSENRLSYQQLPHYLTDMKRETEEGCLQKMKPEIHKTSLPWASNNATISSWPSLAASIKGV